MKRVSGYAIVLVVLVAVVWIGRGVPSGGQAQEGRTAGVLCGDTNGDGVLNIGDPVYTLNFLFLGGTAPRCWADCEATTLEAVCAELKELKAGLASRTFVSVRKGAQIVIPGDAQWHTINFDSKEADAADEFDLGSDTFIPQDDGVYLLHAWTYWKEVSQVGTINLGIFVGDSFVAEDWDVARLTPQDISTQCSRVIALKAGQRVTAKLNNQLGSNQSVILAQLQVVRIH